MVHLLLPAGEVLRLRHRLRLGLDVPERRQVKITLDERQQWVRSAYLFRSYPPFDVGLHQRSTLIWVHVHSLLHSVLAYYRSIDMAGFIVFWESRTSVELWMVDLDCCA